MAHDKWWGSNIIEKNIILRSNTDTNEEDLNISLCPKVALSKVTLLIFQLVLMRLNLLKLRLKCLKQVEKITFKARVLARDGVQNQLEERESTLNRKLQKEVKVRRNKE